MHNLDRTQVGFGQELGDFEFSSGEFGDNELQELAAELMEIGSEGELDNFLGDLISKAGSAIGKLVSSPTGQALTSALKGAAKQLLPMAGKAVGGYFGGSTGSQIGGQLGSAAGNLFGETENEEQEWEAANTFVKLATDAVKNAAAAPPGANPRQVAQQAVMQAAQVHAPGLLGGQGAGGNGSHGGQMPRSGRWIRKHNRIIVLLGA